MEDNKESTSEHASGLTPRARERSAQWLGSETDSGRVVVSVNPFRCRVWDLHDRLEEYVTEESCRLEIESFRAHGQLVPALARPVRDDRDYDVEIVYGVRRLFVARHLGALLRVEVRDMSDHEAVVAMDVENRHRQDMSPYERGRVYQRLLRSKLFTSQDELARTLNVSASQVSRLLKVAQLPSVVVNAFSSPLELREGWGLDLYDGWMKEEMRPLIAQRARALAAHVPRAKAVEVYRCLLSPRGMSKGAGARGRDEVVRRADGTALYRIRSRQRAVAFLIDAGLTSPERMKRIRESLSDILQDSVEA